MGIGRVWAGRGKFTFTKEGGLAIKLTNKTGAASVKGTIVKASESVDSAFQTAAANELETIGAVYTSGVPDGSECWVVICGIAEVLLENDTAATRGHWVRASDTTGGRADATTDAAPGLLLTHFYEIGHCIENKGAGTNVLAKIVMHMN